VIKLTEEEINRLVKIGNKYLYLIDDPNAQEPGDVIPQIAGKGIIAIINEYRKMSDEIQEKMQG
jgi:hypothetical protein